MVKPLLFAVYTSSSSLHGETAHNYRYHHHHHHQYRSCIDSEKRGLLELKAYLISLSTDPHLNILRGWKSDNHSCCRWRRVKCDAISKRVIGLSLGSLDDSRLPDTLPLLNLTLFYPFEDLQSLNLSQSNFQGWFDESQGDKGLGRFRNLETLDLSMSFYKGSVLPFLNEAVSLKTLILRNNFIEGGFPFQELINLRGLEVLDLKFNEFTGQLPGQELTNLRNLKALDLSNNQFSGSLQKPGICRLEQLQELRLSRNRFVGEIPLCFSSFSKLRVLDLSSNHLSGKLPSFIGTFISMEYLSLHDNNFEGMFSLGLISELTELKVLKLSSRSSMLEVVETKDSSGLPSQLTSILLPHCNLGKIPGFLRYQKELRVIDLSSNMLSGVFPTWLLENNTELQVLLLQNNSFNTLTLPRLHKLQFLDLSSNNFNNQLPEDVGLILPSLRHLNISNNGFQGKMPTSVAMMEDIEFMDLSRNNFSGKLPRSLLIGCHSLKWLKLSHNRFSGPIIRKSSDVTSLITLILDNNMFTGKITDNVRNLRLLTVIDLSNNFLTGTIPSWFGNFFLDVLRISNNHLQGAVPPSLFNIPYLWLLDLSGNFLSGSLPPRYSSDYGYILDVHNNNLTGSIPDTLWEGLRLLDLRNNKLSGNVPRFKSTPSINVVLLRGNNLTGKIPEEVCGLSKIRMLDFAHNRLNESIPSCLINLSFGLGGNAHAESDWYPVSMLSYFMEIYTQVNYKSLIMSDRFSLDYSVDFSVQVKFAVKQRYDSYMRGTLDQMFGLDLSSNELSGKIPEELGNLKRVRSMNLSRNALSGFIPGSFSNLTSIESLDLSFNKLHGNIPSQLTMLQSLVVFNVSYNDLSGVIPQGKQFNTFGETSYLGNVLLCGSPTNKSCGITISSGELEEEEDEGGDESGLIDLVVLCGAEHGSALLMLLSVGSLGPCSVVHDSSRTEAHQNSAQLAVKSMVFVLTWMLVIMLPGCRSCIDSERQGLLEIKAYLISVSTDPHIDIIHEWRSSDHSCCRWRRVKCDAITKRVIGLSLGSLEESRPPDNLALLNLTLFYPFEELQSLSLAWSYFQGWFDERQGNKSLRRFKHLEILDLSHNFYNSSVLPFLNEAVSLKTLFLRNNLIEGGFPVQGRTNKSDKFGSTRSNTQRI